MSTKKETVVTGDAPAVGAAQPLPTEAAGRTVEPGEGFWEKEAVNEQPVPLTPPGEPVATHAGRLAPADAWKHAAAAALHGWNEHQYHEGKAVELSAEDYAAALAASEAPGPSGEYEPHEPALSKHAAIANRT